MYDDYRIYDVYNYDASTGESVSSSDLLSMHQISKEDFLTLAKITAISECDEIHKMYFKLSDAAVYDKDDYYASDIYIDYVDSRRRTLSDECFNSDIPLFLNESGDLCGIFDIGVPAGSGISVTMD